MCDLAAFDESEAKKSETEIKFNNVRLNLEASSQVMIGNQEAEQKIDFGINI